MYFVNSDCDLLLVLVSQLSKIIRVRLRREKFWKTIMVPELNIPLTLVRYIFEVVLIFRDIHQCYLAMAPSGYYKFQVVHFDLIPVEEFLADSRMTINF